MLRVSARLLQHPVLLSSSCGNMSKCQMVPIVGTVTVVSSRTREIGGIKIVWESTVQRRKPTTGYKHIWSPSETIESFEVDVVHGTYRLPMGETAFEFVIEVPLALAATRTTHFDKISHMLHAAILDVPPCFDDVIGHNGHRRRLRSALSKMNLRKGCCSTAFPTMPLLAHSTTPLTVFESSTESQGTSYSWRYSAEMGGLGQLDLKVVSPRLVLGQHADFSIDLSALSPTTTIHSVSIKLVQATATATRPAKHSSSTTIPPETCEGRTEMLDQYELYNHGISWARIANRARPFRGAYVWRGSEAACFTTDALGKDDLPVDRQHIDGFGLSTKLIMPSPIIGAHSSSTRPDPAFARISHVLVIRLEYSILGQDTLGRHLPNDEAGDPVEGSVRSWSLEKEIELYSDLSHATTTPAPPYSPSLKDEDHCTVGHSPDSIHMPSVRVPRSVSLGWTRATMMRHIYSKDSDLSVAIRRHWEETGGLCACFDTRDMCESANLSTTEMSVIKA